MGLGLRTTTDDIWAATVEHLQLTAIALGVGIALSIRSRPSRLRLRRTYGPIAGVRRDPLRHPQPGPVRHPLPDHGPDRADRRDRPGRLHAAHPDPQHRGRGRGGARRGEGGGRRHGLPAGAGGSSTVDLRLATPAIIAGIRIASVTTIGLVTVTFVIGFGGYGGLINDGLSRNFNTPVVVGAGLSILLALLIDLILMHLRAAGDTVEPGGAPMDAAQRVLDLRDHRRRTTGASGGSPSACGTTSASSGFSVVVASPWPCRRPSGSATSSGAGCWPCGW